MGRWDTVAEETLDLVVEHRSGAVVPDSRRDEGVLVLVTYRRGGVEEVGIHRWEHRGRKDIPRIEDFLCG